MRIQRIINHIDGIDPVQTPIENESLSQTLQDGNHGV